MENTLIILNKSELTQIVQDAVKDVVAAKSRHPDQPKQFIRGIHGLAKFLGVSPTRAQKLKNDGVISCWQDGRVVLFDPDRVTADLMKSNKQNYRGIKSI